MDFISEGMIEILIWIVSSIITTITGAIAIILNRKKVRKRMEIIDYGAHKEKRKDSYTRNLILDEQIAVNIKENDVDFDALVFKEWVKEIFIEFQKAWTNKNFKSISSMLDNSLCEQYNLLLNTNLKKEYKNIIDIETINYVDFSLYSKDSEKEVVEVAINIVLYDYTINEATKEVIEGSDKIRQRTTYKLSLYRKLGTYTNRATNLLVCPNCGGKIEMKQNKCLYCNTWILNGVKNWVLNNIEKY